MERSRLLCLHSEDLKGTSSAYLELAERSSFWRPVGAPHYLCCTFGECEHLYSCFVKLLKAKHESDLQIRYTPLIFPRKVTFGVIGPGEWPLFWQQAPAYLFLMCCSSYIGTECRNTRFLHHLSTTLWTITFDHFFFFQTAPAFSIPQRSALAPLNPVLTYHNDMIKNLYW